MIYSTAMPCDRGVPNNAAIRGLHKFVANPYGVVCEYCGRYSTGLNTTTGIPVQPGTGRPYYTDGDAPGGGARQGQDER